MIRIYHTVYENTKREINSYAYFNKTYHNPRPLDVGTFVLKRNFLHVHFPYKLKPLRIGPFKIINKISEITYEIVNQDVPFLQQYNLYLFNDNYSSINDQIFDSDENQISDEDQFSPTKFNKETDIPSTIDFQLESFSQYSSFPYQQKEQDSQYTNSDNQSDIHDYDNFINPRRHSYNRYNFRPQP